MVEIQLDIKYNYVLFIESLKPGECGGTERIFREVVEPKCTEIGIVSQYVHLSKKEELLNLLSGLGGHSEHVYPIIHIACHGSDKGLELLSDTVLWREFQMEMCQININSKNHLYLIMAMCFGAFSFDFHNWTTRAPYYCMIGPQRDIVGVKLDSLLLNFYTKLFETNNVLNAVGFMKLQNQNEKVPFIVHTCVDSFLEVMKLMLKEAESGKSRHHFIEELKLKFGESIPYELKSKFQYKDQLMEVCISLIKDFKNEYLMIDLYPENAARFFNIELYQDDVK